MVETDNSLKQGAEKISDAQEWWNDDREAVWEQLDEIAREVEEQFNRYRKHSVWVSINTAAPNPKGIASENKPGEWHYDVGVPDVDAEKIKELLSDKIKSDVTVQERPDEWADGYWFVVEKVSKL
ncbi:hypothetical protein OSG_eHP15_00045 [environmental Halophage eHP-15]|nr:hypothetical protein OSG_eHP15_00045 [environmental Halophage eHP-15]